MKKTLDAREIPKHYVPLTKYGGTRASRSGKRVENWEYRFLRERWYAGELDGVKLLRSPTDDKGHVYVDPSSVEALLAEAKAHRASASTADSRAMRDVVHDKGDTFPVFADSSIVTALHSCAETLASIVAGQAALLAEVRRLAEAAEAIATQPLARMADVAIAEPSGTWRDMNGEAL